MSRLAETPGRLALLLRTASVISLVAGAAVGSHAQVVISQVYGGNGNVFDRDYVELFNRGSAPISLSGSSIQYASATGTGLFSANGISPLSGTLESGQYLLVGLGTSAATGAALPAPFVAGNAATNMSANNGKVVLVASTAGLACNGGSTPCSPAEQALILDLVGYGSADYFEGTAAAPAATTTTAIFRNGDGCQDTSSNGADFVAATPSPRTALTQPNPCPTTTVSLSVDPASGSEAAASTITVTVTASAPVVGDQSVSVSVGGVGITANDYALGSSTITLASSTTIGTTSFAVVDDVLVEDAEIATLTISNPTAGIALGAPTSSNVTLADDDGCGSAGVTAIHDVQGSAGASPLVGQTVAVEGIVIGSYRGTSADSLQGFFLQEEDADADADPSTSEGLFVFEGNGSLGAGIGVGDRVLVAGTVIEFQGKTELGSVTSVALCATGDSLPTATALVLPVPGVPNGDLALATAAINAYYERVEGMRVRFPATLAVSEPFQLERFGQLTLSQGGRISSFTAANAPSVAGYRDHQIDVAKRKVVLDDGDDRQQSALTNARPLPYPQPGLSITNRFRGGDEITGLTGVLDWSSAGAAGTDAWRLRPVPETETYTFVPANPRPAGPPNVGGSLRIASLNVRNFFSTVDATASNTSGSCGPDGLQDCRGADSLAERVRQTDKLVAALCRLDADVVGLMEMENDAFSTASVLVAATNAVPDCGPYGFVNSGPIGGDVIKVGLLYRTTTVTASGPHAILDSTVDPRFLDTRHRPVLAQSFVETATGSKWTVAVVHLKSKGSACSGDPDLGDGQGNCNLTRTTAAQAIVDWLATDPTASGDPDHLIIGDLNSYTHEEPVRAIEAGPDDAAATSDDYVDVMAALVGPTAYGYVFDGQVGRLDHALASASMASQVLSAGVWHINADEPPSFDYNDTIVDVGEAAFEAKPTALPLYSADEFRTSDHDPLVIGLPEPGLGISLAAGLFAAGMSARRRRMTISAGGRRRMEGGRGL